MPRRPPARLTALAAAAVVAGAAWTAAWHEPAAARADDAPAGPVHSSSDYPQDEAMARCLAALDHTPHLPLHRYRMSCAPRLVQGSSAGHAALVGGNTYRDSADVVVATYLTDAALARVVQHEAVHAYTLENPPVQAALGRWATRHGLPGDVLGDAVPYPQRPYEVFAAAWARCHGGGPDPVIDDALMSCADADAVAAAR